MLQGLAGAAVGLPLLPSLLPRTARAAPLPAPPKRFVVVARDGGFNRSEWYPSAAATAAMAPLASGGKQLALTSLQGPISATLGAEWDGLRSKMLLLRSVNTISPRATGHCPTEILSGSVVPSEIGDARYLYPTIDQVMANSPKVYPTAPRLRSLNLRVLDNPQWSDSDLSQTLVNGTTRPGALYTQPQAAFDAVFGTTSTPPGNEPGRKRALLIDQVLEQFKGLKAHPRASLEDKQVLDAHMAALDDLQRRVQATANVCAAPARPGSAFPDQASAAARSQLIDVYTELLVTALKCGHTRIGTLTLMRLNGTDPINFDPIFGNDLGGDWHNWQHNNEAAYYYSTNGHPWVREFHQWGARKVLNLCKALDVPEPGTNGTYLDNSIVYYGNTNGDSDHRSFHRQVLVVGGGGGALQTDRFIDYAGVNGNRIAFQNATVQIPCNGRVYSQFLVTMLQAMGLTEADYATPDIAAKGLPRGWGDSRSWVGGYDASARGDPLPGVLK